MIQQYMDMALKVKVLQGRVWRRGSGFWPQPNWQRRQDLICEMTKWKRIPVSWDVTMWVSDVSKGSEIMKNREASNFRRQRGNCRHSDATSRHRKRGSAVALPWNFGNLKGEVACIFTDQFTKMRVKIRVNLYAFTPSPQVELNGQCNFPAALSRGK